MEGGSWRQGPLEEGTWRKGGRELEEGNWRQGAGGKELAAGNWRKVSGGREIEVKNLEVVAFFPESLSYLRVSSKNKKQGPGTIVAFFFLKAVVVASILWHCFGRSSVRVCDYVISLSHVVDHHSKYS